MALGLVDGLMLIKDVGGIAGAIQVFNNGSNADRRATEIKEGEVKAAEGETVEELRMKAGKRYLQSSLIHVANIGLSQAAETFDITNSGTDYTPYLIGQGVMTYSSFVKFLETRGVNIPDTIKEPLFMMLLSSGAIWYMDRVGEIDGQQWAVPLGVLAMAIGVSCKSELAKWTLTTLGGLSFTGGVVADTFISDWGRNLLGLADKASATIPTLSAALIPFEIQFTWAQGRNLIRTVKSTFSSPEDGN